MEWLTDFYAGFTSAYYAGFFTSGAHPTEWLMAGLSRLVRN